MARRSRLCLAGLAAFLIVYLFLGVLAVIGATGMFGVTPDPFLAVWLIFIGMPWTAALALFPGGSFSEFLARIFVGLVPLVNLWLLSLLCSRRRPGR